LAIIDFIGAPMVIEIVARAGHRFRHYRASERLAAAEPFAQGWPHVLRPEFAVVPGERIEAGNHTPRQT
jgi:hypothetical protein